VRSSVLPFLESLWVSDAFFFAIPIIFAPCDVNMSPVKIRVKSLAVIVNIEWLSPFWGLELNVLMKELK